MVRVVSTMMQPVSWLVPSGRCSTSICSTNLGVVEGRRARNHSGRGEKNHAKRMVLMVGPAMGTKEEEEEEEEEGRGQPP